MKLYEITVDPDWGTRFPRENSVTVIVASHRRPTWGDVLGAIPRTTRERFERICKNFFTEEGGLPSCVSIAHVKVYTVLGRDSV